MTTRRTTGAHRSTPSFSMSTGPWSTRCTRTCGPGARRSASSGSTSPPGGSTAPSGWAVTGSSRRSTNRTVERSVGDDVRERHSLLYAELPPIWSPTPGATDLLEALKKRGLLVVLASSASREDTDGAVAMLEAGHLIDGSICGDDTDSSKPDSEPVQTGCRDRRRHPCTRDRGLRLGHGVGPPCRSRAGGPPHRRGRCLRAAGRRRGRVRGPRRAHRSPRRPSCRGTADSGSPRAAHPVRPDSCPRCAVTLIGLVGSSPSLSARAARRR